MTLTECFRSPHYEVFELSKAAAVQTERRTLTGQIPKTTFTHFTPHTTKKTNPKPVG